jgi:hypothetical protein
MADVMLTMRPKRRCFTQCGGRLVDFRLVAPVDQDMDAFLRQRLRARQSQPLTGRANDGGAPFDAEIHVVRSLSLLIEIAGFFLRGSNGRHSIIDHSKKCY